ncbi:hypothetical protein [Chamaesiphon sp. VAR_48_metabat_135_sub]|uniref:hypothetical protein n=1 Tax=Chamaesiphon sp. VAR_48_metabat_135_sub TaxID=2964699 RepID=UPI00286D676B|nr:hypothetical protein [Chamaesiphon sp. VAR_48_metabat_135_sub]
MKDKSLINCLLSIDRRSPIDIFILSLGDWMCMDSIDGFDRRRRDDACLHTHFQLSTIPMASILDLQR